MINSNYDELINQFDNADLTKYPDISHYSTAGEQGLWILWVAKEELGIKRLSAGQIVNLLIEVFEVSLKDRSIVNSFNAYGTKVHRLSVNGLIEYEIMKSGKDFLKEKAPIGIDLYLFDPNTKFSSQHILAENIFGNLAGELKIFEPYCGDKTLDLLSKYDDGNINYLTTLQTLRQQQKIDRITRSIKDFQIEYSHVSFKNYQSLDLHDRYIISDDKFVLLGHGIKDLGGKESFAVLYDRSFNSDLIDSISSTFNRRWNNSTPI